MSDLDFLKKIWFVGLIAASSPVFAQQSGPVEFVDQTSMLTPRPFSDDQIGLSLNRNFPLGVTRKTYGASRNYNLSVIYRRLLTPEWIAGIQFGFKAFFEHAKQSDLHIMSLTHEIYRLIRVYHPWYIGLGYRVQYLAPVVKQDIPTERVPDTESEVGAALSASICSSLSDETSMVFYADRWRGTKTSKLHGIEVGFGLLYQLR